MALQADALYQLLAAQAAAATTTHPMWFAPQISDAGLHIGDLDLWSISQVSRNILSLQYPNQFQQCTPLAGNLFHGSFRNTPFVEQSSPRSVGGQYESKVMSVESLLNPVTSSGSLLPANSSDSSATLHQSWSCHSPPSQTKFHVTAIHMQERSHSSGLQWYQTSETSQGKEDQQPNEKKKSKSPKRGKTSDGTQNDPQKRKWKVVLTPQLAALIYKLKPRGNRSKSSSIQLSKRHGVSPKTIRDIWNKATWAKATRHLWESDDDDNAAAGLVTDAGAAAAAAAIVGSRHSLPPSVGDDDASSDATSVTTRLSSGLASPTC